MLKGEPSLFQWFVGAIKISRLSFNNSPNRKTHKKKTSRRASELYKLESITCDPFYSSPTPYALLLRSWQRQTKELLSQTRSWRITCEQEKVYLFDHTYPVGNWILFWTSLSSLLSRLSTHSPAHPSMRKAACRPEVEQTCHESDQKLQVVTITIEHQTASKLPLMIFFQSASKPGRILLQELVSCHCGNINDVHVIKNCNHTCFPTLATNLLHVPVHDYMPLLQPPLQHKKNSTLDRRNRRSQICFQLLVKQRCCHGACSPC